MPDSLPPDEPVAQQKSRILVVDDEVDIRESLDTLLTLEGYSVDLAQHGTEGLRKAEAGNYDLILLDLMMPDRSGMEVLKEIRERDLETPIFMITAYGSVEVAVDALKNGANDYFSKPWDNEKLLIEIDRMIATSRLARENIQLKRAFKQQYSFPNIVGKSDRMLRILDLVTQVAPSRATILITGETGTGKELIAKAVHANSARADQLFVPVNSGSVPSDLLESALFGHVKGAFTGAMRDHWGKVKAASGGTLFLDEIGDLPIEIQPKLLRLLQEREYERVGENVIRQAEVRIIAATSHDLKKRAAEGAFREDLYFRLNVITAEMPPLRQRQDDLLRFAGHFLKHFTALCGRRLDGFSAEASAAIRAYSWPGNLREMRNAIERAVIMAQGTKVTLEDLPAESRGQALAGTNGGDGILQVGGLVSMEQLEGAHIRKVLERTSNLAEAAQVLGIDQATLYRKRKKIGLE